MLHGSPARRAKADSAGVTARFAFPFCHNFPTGVGYESRYFCVRLSTVVVRIVSIFCRCVAIRDRQRRARRQVVPYEKVDSLLPLRKSAPREPPDSFKFHSLPTHIQPSDMAANLAWEGNALPAIHGHRAGVNHRNTYLLAELGRNCTT